jgi:hypothetical protein
MVPTDAGAEGQAASAPAFWQLLAGHGVQDIACADAIARRLQEVEAGLEQVCNQLARVVSDQDMLPLQRIRSLRSKPQIDHKSLYECINQLTHYWYCCVAAQHLISLGCTDVRMRPTGTDSHSAEGDAFDVVASHPSGTRVIAEVFCVSPSLWQTKVANTVAKLKSWPNDALRLVYYNQECKPSFRPKSTGFHFFGITAPTGEVQLVCSTDQRRI